MKTPPLRLRETRRHIVEILRTRGEQTVEELARTIGLSRTAVMNHLRILQGEGFVTRRGLRHGGRRPSVIYALTPAAEELFPRSYDEFASLLLEEARRKGAGDLNDLMRRVGDRWIARDLPRVDGLRERQRIEEAVKILSERGFMPALEAAAQGPVLREHNCPMMRLTTAHPELCDVVHRWLEAIFGTRLQRLQCQRDGALFSTYALQLPKPR